MAEKLFTLMRSRKLSKSFKYQGMYNEFNQRHGYGKSIFPNGDEYEGYYSYGKRHGFGVYKYRNGAVYVGDFCNGKKVGLGRIIYPDGSCYDGKWKDDERHGFGIYRYSNGDVYEGNWRENQRQGSGKYTHLSAGMQYIGIWTKGFREVEGQLVDINSAVYMGDLKRIEADRENIRNHRREQLVSLRTDQGIEFEQTARELLTSYLDDITVTYPGAEAVVEKEGRRLWWLAYEANIDLLTRTPK